MKKLCIFLYILYPVLMIAALLLHPATAGLSAVRLGGLALGSVAYVMLCAQLIITARIPPIERAFGQDSLLRFHGIAALAAIALSFVHAFEIHWGLFTPRLRYGEVALALFVVLTVLALFFMSNVITGRWKGAAALQKKLYAACQLSRYHAQLLLHNLMALAVVILFFHLAVRMKQFWDNGPFAALSVLCCVVSVACWIWHIFLRKGCAYRVTEVIREGAGMTTLRLEPAGAKVFDYMPGQFAYFRFHDPALTEESHPFTLSSSPKETLVVTIKDLGDWSSRVQEIRPGSLAELDGPYGRFSPLLYPERPSVFIAGGVGITPMMSILHDACLRGTKERMLLLWCVRSREDLIRRDEWTELQKKLPSLTILPVLSREEAEGCAHGHLSGDIMKRAMAQCGIRPEEAAFYYCGPEPLRKTVSRIMAELHVPSDRFHEERFSL